MHNPEKWKNQRKFSSEKMPGSQHVCAEVWHEKDFKTIG